MKVPKCHYTHAQGDDGNAWTLPYFPPTMTTEGWDADCIQCMMMTLSRLSNLAVLLKHRHFQTGSCLALDRRC